MECFGFDTETESLSESQKEGKLRALVRIAKQMENKLSKWKKVLAFRRLNCPNCPSQSINNVRNKLSANSGLPIRASTIKQSSVDKCAIVYSDDDLYTELVFGDDDFIYDDDYLTVGFEK